MRGFLKFLLGIVLFLAGLLGMIGAFLASSSSSLTASMMNTTEPASWPFVIFGIISFVLCIGGIYLTRRK